MNRAKLKNYAPQARRDFIQVVTDRAAYYGLTPKKTEAIIEKGDVALISGMAFPRSVVQKRRALEDRISRHGFEQVMEMMAYTWFNRFVAIRFMEIHGYLDHGYRVLSHPEGKAIPEILEHAEHVDLPGLDRNKVIEMKLEGKKEEELYRLILIAQCNALHSAMPFLFEWINDETELLIPDNLLHSDSLIRKLVNETDEKDWQEVEIIGWLYESYISEKKDEVIGKVVRSEDIPAATQRFTPNWIVKYLVQNTLGRQWLTTYPNSPLRQQMAYYIEPAEQTPEVQAQLKAITPESLNPEEIALLDLACGSGHILAEAYGPFKAIYQERGYRAKDIPRLILEKNLYGLEIDDRAAQLAAFALMMKACKDDPRIFDSKVQPNVLAIQESKGLDARNITEALNAPLDQGEKKGQKGNISQADLANLIDLFEHGKTFGSLIRIPESLAAKLSTISERVKTALTYGDLLSQAAAKALLPLVKQSIMLAGHYEAVVTNPPYMSSKFYNSTLKSFVRQNYKDVQGDLFSCFIKRNIELTPKNGFIGMITIPNWMFLSTFYELRKNLIESTCVDSLIHNGRGIFGSDFGTCTFIIRNALLLHHKGIYRRLFDRQGSVASIEELRERFFQMQNIIVDQREFLFIPGAQIAYWISPRMRRIFAETKPLSTLADIRQGMSTTENFRFLRCWYELPITEIAFGCDDAFQGNEKGKNWFPYNKGGDYRKWYGNNRFVVLYEDNGRKLLSLVKEKYPRISDPEFVIKNRKYFFKPSVTWSFVSSSFFGVRRSDKGFIFDVGGSSVFPVDPSDLNIITGFMCTVLASKLLNAMNPTLNFPIESIGSLPVAEAAFSSIKEAVSNIVEQAVSISRQDWDSFETSWDFGRHPFIEKSCSNKIEDSYIHWCQSCEKAIQKLQELECENNRLFIESYGIQEEVSPEVPEEHITLARPDREEDAKRLISYAIGCIMGRYSLDKPGLIYAHSKNMGFDPNQYTTFPADQDGIIPVMEGEWFSYEAADRFVEFITAAWPGEHLEENLKFIAESLGSNGSEEHRETIRHYLAIGFFKDHLKTYKRRPIYWLFSSGKLRAFQCLVYLHRYNEGTLSRMRTEYVIPLQGKIASRIEQLLDEIQNATSTSHRKKMEKERDTLIKQQAELKSFDEKLRHYTDLRISLDLDDGVKVNYGKFGDLLAEVKTVTGGSDE